MKELNDMKYLECAIKESLRLYPSVPFLGRHLHEDVQIGEYLIPSGTMALVSTYVLHRDKNVFPKPEIYDPDRFLPENSIGRHPYAYIPFSAGPRNCKFDEIMLLSQFYILFHFFRIQRHWTKVRFVRREVSHISRFKKLQNRSNWPAWRFNTVGWIDFTAERRFESENHETAVKPYGIDF